MPAGPSARPLRTAYWHNDEEFELAWPVDWSVSVFWPSTPPPLSADQIADAIGNPVGLSSLADLFRGKRRPLIVVDDLSRATPAADILRPLLAEMEGAGIGAHQVTILLATGTHQAPSQESIVKKIGTAAAGTCRVVVHDDSRNCSLIGKTEFGTPILVDREVLDADLLIGIGGIYPNNTAGFGGGPKLSLGVLGRLSIAHLHEKHRPATWGHHDQTLPFRRDLEQIATTIGLTSIASVHVDHEARPVRAVFGDYRAYYDDEVTWAEETYKVAAPGDAHVVVSNSYPVDNTLVSARMKAMAPLRACGRDASRILLASCFRGPGGHGLFPLENPPLIQRVRRKASVMSPAQFAGAIAGGMRRRLSRGGAEFRWPVMLYRPGTGPKPELPQVGGIELAPSWQAVIDTIVEQQQSSERLRVAVYPCASLQVIDAPPFAGEALE